MEKKINEHSIPGAGTLDISVYTGTKACPIFKGGGLKNDYNIFWVFSKMNTFGAGRRVCGYFCELSQNIAFFFFFWGGGGGICMQFRVFS